MAITIRFLSGEQVEFDAKTYADLLSKIAEHIDLESKYRISLVDPETESEAVTLEKTYYMAVIRRRRLLDWIDPDRLDWFYLAGRTYAVDYIRDNLIHQRPTFTNTHWSFLSKNPQAIDLLRENVERIDWHSLCVNPSREAFELMEENLDRVDWEYIVQNPHPYLTEFMSKHHEHFPNQKPIELPAYPPPLTGDTNTFKSRAYYTLLAEMSNDVKLLKDEIKHISLYCLCRNTNPEILPLFEELWDELDNYWDLSKNPVVWPLLKKSPEKISFRGLAYNPLPEAIQYLFEKGTYELNIDSIIWTIVSSNPSAIPYLEKHQDRINYEHLSRNPGIFQ